MKTIIKKIIALCVALLVVSINLSGEESCFEDYGFAGEYPELLANEDVFARNPFSENSFASSLLSSDTDMEDDTTDPGENADGGMEDDTSDPGKNVPLTGELCVLSALALGYGILRYRRQRWLVNLRSCLN